MNDYNSSDDESTTILTQDMLGDSFGDNTDKLTSDMKEEFQNAKRNAMVQNNIPPMNQGQRPMQQSPMNQGQRPMQQPPMNQGQRPMQQPPMGQGQRPMQQPPMGQSQRPMQQPPMNQGQRPMQQSPMNREQAVSQKNNRPSNQSNTTNGKKDSKPVKKSSGGVIAYTIISLVLICGLVGLCVWGYLHYDKKVKNLKKEKDNSLAEIETLKADYETKLSEKDTTIDDLNTQISDAQSVSGRYETIINYLNSYGTSGGYLDYFISAKDITLKSGEEATFTIFVENPDNGIYYEQTSSDIAWIETTSEAYDGNSNIKGFTVHGFQPGTVTVSLIATDTNEIINLTIHVVE